MLVKFLRSFFLLPILFMFTSTLVSDGLRLILSVSLKLFLPGRAAGRELFFHDTEAVIVDLFVFALCIFAGEIEDIIICR